MAIQSGFKIGVIAVIAGNLIIAIIKLAESLPAVSAEECVKKPDSRLDVPEKQIDKK